ncbi:hypothetical protein FRX31_031747 [Thalictrum thalictroides]|uniref:Uncharacterized protein n=1 Tax=Thalictrum thalictroides TaxID=46969 RepID=A0A7J6V126_THATH|nr:hypothetical protein FRX31_031747 [Thalictrum thalictroides]
MDNLETTSNQEVDSNLKKSNIEAVNGGSSSPSQNTITNEGTCMNLETDSDLILKTKLDQIEQDVDCSNKRSSLEVSRFRGGNPNDMAGSSKGSGHANEGGGNTTNPNVAADGIKESWSSILGRHAVSKKNLPFYAPTIVEGAMISIDVEEDEMGDDKKEETINEAVSNPTDGDNKQFDENVAVEDEVEKLGDNEEWETPNKKHTTRAATVLECRNNGVVMVQGKLQKVLPSEEAIQATTRAKAFRLILKV